MALDLVRAMSNADDAKALVGELLDEVRDFPGRAERKAAMDTLLAEAELETRAREFAETIALLAAAAALQQTAPQIAEMFLQAGYNGERRRLYGSGRPHEVSSRLLERASPD
jgi:putative acyl-CoA dehydrogenase